METNEKSPIKIDGITPEMAKKMLEANSKAMVSKLSKGSTLSKGDIAKLEKIVAMGETEKIPSRRSVYMERACYGIGNFEKDASKLAGQGKLPGAAKRRNTRRRSVAKIYGYRQTRLWFEKAH